MSISSASARDAISELDVSKLVARHGAKPSAAIPILHEIQDRLRWLPREILLDVCGKTGITPAQIEGVSTFYTRFRHKPCGRRLIQVCHGTACHVAGADQVTDALRRELALSPGQETSADGMFTLERVACLGCCTIAPMMLIDRSPYGRLDPNGALRRLEASRNAAPADPQAEEKQLWDRLAARGVPGAPEIELRVGLNSCCMVNGSLSVSRELESATRRRGGRVRIKPVGCTGMCHIVPLVEVVDRYGSRLYGANDAKTALEIVRRHVPARGWLNRLRESTASALAWAMPDNVAPALEPHAIDASVGPEAEFLAGQTRIVTENFGEMNPLDIAEYRARGGYEALRRCLTEMTPEEVIDQIRQSGLRGRGGAGFPTGEKWAIGRRAQGDIKYVVCNGDEGDPGAFMDRMLLEAYPHRVIEGLIVSAYAMGAKEGFFYIRHEYGLAVRRIQAALVQARAAGFLGDDILGSGYSLKLAVAQGAGAFVCGEETALIQSIEGSRGMPRFRPPYPSERGLWGRPTNVNNVETLGCVAWIVRHGPQAFAAIGTERSKGTKVFALAGKIRRGGLIEVPMGTTIWSIVHDIGGGVGEGRRFKAVQLGGPSGGCIPASLANTPVDYESVTGTGAIMGSGGMIVMDDATCMVDMARYFLDFTQKESCGRCTFCRVGTKRMLEILERLCEGRGKSTDLETLETLAGQVRSTSLCGLGRSAPNPVLTTLKYFREEFQAHLEGRCPAGVCTGLIRYDINAQCIGCTICAQECPVDAIAATAYQVHVIDQDRCVQCGICKRVCPKEAVDLRPRRGTESGASS